MLLVAGLLLAARLFLRRLNLPHPSVDAILAATSVGRTRAYQLRDLILAALPGLQRAPGRPPRSAPSVPPSTKTLTGEVLDFVVKHPGCFELGTQRRHYGKDFSRFIIQLRDCHAAVDLPTFAEAVRVPLGTLEDWLRAELEPPPAATPDRAPQLGDAVMSTRLQTIIDAWRRWKGPFTTFCEHVNENLRIPYRRTMISSILDLSGVRTPQRRPSRSPDEKALRGLFETFFPGAQWVGDGSPVTVQLALGRREYRFTFNLELMTDPASGAFVGISVRDEEDAAAVTEAFTDGVDTTGAPPLALLLDNRPSNHTEEVDQTLDETLRIRATRGRAQNKAHTEGGFGLFKSTAPPFEVSAGTPRELAAQILDLVVTTWARTLNHRPRVNRGGLSRVELYEQHKPTPEQIEQAREALEERRRKQEKALETRRARQDPVARKLLDSAFERIGLLDPESNIRSAIARYPLDAIIAGIATYEGKRDAGTLPDGVDARYLRGIVRNIAHQDEGIHISHRLLQRRLEARDLALTFLEAERDTVLQHTSDGTDRVKTFVDNAMSTDRYLDRLFWLDATAATLATHAGSESERHDLFRFAARCIHCAFRIPHKERLAATRLLARQAVIIHSPPP